MSSQRLDSLTALSAGDILATNGLLERARLLWSGQCVELVSSKRLPLYINRAGSPITAEVAVCSLCALAVMCMFAVRPCVTTL